MKIYLFVTMIIFKRKPPKEQISQWCDNPSAPKRIDGQRRHNQMVRRNVGLLKKHSMLVWYQFRAYLTKKVKKSLKVSNTIQPIIPGGLTGMLQPLDASTPLETHMRNL